MNGRKHNQSFLAQASALAIAARSGLDKARGNEGKAIAMMVHGLVTAWASPMQVTVLSKVAGEDEQTEKFTATLDDYRFPKMKEDGTRDKLHRGAMVQAIMSQLCEVTLDAKGKAPLAAQAVFRLAYPAAALIVRSKCHTEWDAKKGTFTVVADRGGKTAGAKLAGMLEASKGSKAFVNAAKDAAIKDGVIAKPDGRQGRAGGNAGKAGGESKGVISAREAKPLDLFRMASGVLEAANASDGESEVVFGDAETAELRKLSEQIALYLEAESAAS